jgi:predicted AlkP superfamily phosphohydrolase/phosphomutase
MTASSRKVLILGLDGATWRLLRPLIDAGELPHLAGLVEAGSSGVLRSSIPPLTAPAWSNFQTGANAGKHGIFDFRVFDRAARKLWLVSSRDLKLPTLWQIASAAGRQVIAVNVPMTYPPQPVNGIVIGGMLAQQEDQTLIYPAERFDEILRRHPQYRISPPVVSQRGSMGRRAFVEANIAVERERCELALDLMAGEPWDLFMVQNQCLDYIQHSYYHLMDKDAAEFDPAGHADVLRFYKAMDENVGRLVEAAPPDSDVVVLSDHGFKLQHHLVHLAPWLRSQGYLVEEISPRQRLLQLARRADVLKLRRHLAHWVLRDKKARFGTAASTALGRIDWTRSRAFVAIGSVFGCVYLNHDAVADVDGLAQELADHLLTLADPDTGRQVVQRVFRGQEVYHGPFAQNGPDLIAEPAEDYTFGAPSLVAHQRPFASIDFELEIPGGHHPDGILIWTGNGANLRRGLRVDLIDVAPTVLARMGIPVPEHMDGRVLGEMFDTTVEASFQTWSPAEAADADEGYSPEDEEALRERLEGLGYL